MGNADTESTTRPNRTICVPISQDDYYKNFESAENFRNCLDEHIKHNLELFPPEIVRGYKMKDIYHSRKLPISFRRIEIGGIPYTIRPSFVMPYMTGFTKDIQMALFLRKFAVPFWALSRCCGRDPMYWYRIEATLGRFSLVGTTVKDPQLLPQHISADEKHTRIKGEKAYIPCTVGSNCILGVAVKESAGQADLENGYGDFKSEAQTLDPDYCPKTVNTDGWLATMKTFKSLFPGITLIACFLHIYIAIRDRSRKKFSRAFLLVSDKLWNCYEAKTKASFSQRIRRFHEWAHCSGLPPVIIPKIDKLRDKLSSFSVAYDFPGGHRTSNMADRLMQRLDRYLFSTQYFHGSLEAAQRGIRAWALIQNFAPSNPVTVKKYLGMESPAERLAGSRYHHCWLQNLLVSASLGGFRGPPQNPI